MGAPNFSARVIEQRPGVTTTTITTTTTTTTPDTRYTTTHHRPQFPASPAAAVNTALQHQELRGQPARQVRVGERARQPDPMQRVKRPPIGNSGRRVVRAVVVPSAVVDPRRGN